MSSPATCVPALSGYVDADRAGRDHRRRRAGPLFGRGDRRAPLQPPVAALRGGAARGRRRARRTLAGDRLRRRAGKLHRAARRPGGRPRGWRCRRASRSTWSRRWRRWRWTSSAPGTGGRRPSPASTRARARSTSRLRRRPGRRWSETLAPCRRVQPADGGRLARPAAGRPRRRQRRGAPPRSPGTCRRRTSPAPPPSPSAAWRCCSAPRGEAADLATAVPSYGRPPDITVTQKGPEVGPCGNLRGFTPESPTMNVQLFDTTLRDGTQSEGLSLSVEDKLKIARLLDGFGIHFIEGGYPGSNPKDVEFFQRAKSLHAQARQADRVRHDPQGGRQGRRRSDPARAGRRADAGGLHRRQVLDPARHRGAGDDAGREPGDDSGQRRVPQEAGQRGGLRRRALLRRLPRRPRLRAGDAQGGRRRGRRLDRAVRHQRRQPAQRRSPRS